MTQAQIPPIVGAYFGADATHPIIRQTFIPGRGWRRSRFRKRVSASFAYKLAGGGVTHVQLASGGRLADFAIGELAAMYRRR